MHGNIARPYDCLQGEHDRVRVAWVKILCSPRRPIPGIWQFRGILNSSWF